MSIDELKTKVSDEDLQEALDYFKLAPGVDDAVVKLDILAARRKVMGEVGEELDTFYDDNPIFKIAVLLDAYTHYNNRDKDSTAMIFEHPAYQNDINALKDDYRVMMELYGPDDDSDLEEDDDG